MVVSSSGLTFADDNTQLGTIQKNNEYTQQRGDFQGPPPKGEFHRHDNGDMQKFHPSRAEMEKKKAEFEKRLKLTDEQKQKIENNRHQGHEQVKPIMEQQRLKMQEIKKIYKDNTLTQEQKEQKAATLKEEINKLKEQANAYREQNIKDFESILTEKQKKEFAKIKQEQKKDMEKRRAEFEKKAGKKGQFAPQRKNGSFPPPPMPDEQ